MTIVWHLLKTDLELLFENLIDKAINVLIWTVCTTAIAGYVFQEYGMTKDYGLFQAAGSISGVIGFELYAQMFMLLSDLEGNNHLSYLLTLPVPRSVIFLKFVALYTLNGIILALMSLPIIKLVLFSQFDLSQVSWLLLLISIIASSFFFAVFTFFLVSLTPSVSKVESIIMRVLFPIWFLGCFQFSYYAAHKIAPLFGYITLISPYTFATESTRYAMLKGDYLPFWLCIAALLTMAFLSGYVGFKKLKKRLDFV